MDHVQPSPERQMFTVTVYLAAHFLPSMEGFAVFLYWEHILIFFLWQSLVPQRHSKTNQKYARAHTEQQQNTQIFL